MEQVEQELKNLLFIREVRLVLYNSCNPDTESVVFLPSTYGHSFARCWHIKPTVGSLLN
ncbi:hypothetical protein HMPREF0083_04737 [Aneurinibacillus aneurinilyticus ATCC 12856]|uniref:Uncharacterized protein n=1 Tax=Aneurinibacillus aneurinilyticus ATCC 12856 TaxID=649747 RepID=U1WF27_ANEAE|nr:hypothetical protein HMPREF0083_04737 [Aneurinibacillus aneurinilyticus ATCC 12856]